MMRTRGTVTTTTLVDDDHLLLIAWVRLYASGRPFPQWPQQVREFVEQMTDAAREVEAERRLRGSMSSRVPVAEAAVIEGCKPDTIRKQARRNQRASHRDKRGRLYVDVRPAQDADLDAPNTADAP